MVWWMLVVLLMSSGPLLTIRVLSMIQSNGWGKCCPNFIQYIVIVLGYMFKVLVVVCIGMEVDGIDIC